tara:strand:- start:1579 stop:1701 length:123 start_codon:yes stop_codon:yes gene_type:complete
MFRGELLKLVANVFPYECDKAGTLIATMAVIIARTGSIVT